jgi:hypothetical protein
MRIKALLLAFLLLLAANPAHAALSLDGTAEVTGATITLSTTKTNDVIVLVIRSIGGVTVAVTDTAGLHWTKEATTGLVGASVQIDIWYAVSPSILSSDVITPTGYSSMRLTAFGVNGANTTTPIDPNASIPATGGAASETSQSLTISTNNPNDFLISTVGATASLGTITEPSGFTQVISAGTAEDVSYKIVSSTLSSSAITYSWTSAQTVAMAVTAIQAPSTNVDMLFQGAP